MARRLTIEPVTRIEGHARVTIELDDAGRVQDARVHVTQLRGFEAFCAGRLLREMPALTSRICGICPVSHAIASAKAGDVILGAPPPPAARMLRTLVLLGQLVQSHALSFFFLASPDFVGRDGGDPARRSFLGVAGDEPELVRQGIELRRFGLGILERLAGQRVHPAFAVPGGVVRPLEEEVRQELRAALPGALDCARRTLDWWWRRLSERADERRIAGGELESLFLAMVGPRGELDPYDGRIRVVSASGAAIADGVPPARYHDVLGEEVEPWTYAKLAYWRELGPSAGTYLVGPLARLNVARRCGTPLADAELERFRALAPGPVRSIHHAHLARLVEILYALERIGDLLADPELASRDVLASPGEQLAEGVGACEAPRGTLFHHYRVDPGGVVTWVDLLVPTGQNSSAMNRTVRRIAARSLTGARITDALASEVEAGLRAFDPCLSCATHAAGAPRVSLRLVGPRGEVLDDSAR